MSFTLNIPKEKLLCVPYLCQCYWYEDILKYSEASNDLYNDEKVLIIVPLKEFTHFDTISSADFKELG